MNLVTGPPGEICDVQMGCPRVRGTDNSAILALQIRWHQNGRECSAHTLAAFSLDLSTERETHSPPLEQELRRCLTDACRVGIGHKTETRLGVDIPRRILELGVIKGIERLKPN